MSNSDEDYNYQKAPFRVRIVKYKCDTCFRRWQSANGNLTDYQLCKNCYQKCYPGEHKWQTPNKQGNQNRETFIAHNTELCGKCIRLGFSCMELIREEQSSGTVVSNDDGEDILLENNSDLSSFIVRKDKVDKKMKKVDKVPNKNTLGKQNQALKERQEWPALMNTEKKEKAETKVTHVDETKESKDKKNYVAPKKAVAVVEIKTEAEKVADDNKTNMEDRKYESEDKKDVNVEMNNEIRPGYVRTVLRIIRAMRDKREKKEENVDNQEGVESLAVMKNPEKDIMSYLND